MAEIIMQIFNKIGAAAGRAKIFWVFSMAVRKADSPIKNINGDIHSVSFTVILNFSGSSENPGANAVIISGEKVYKAKLTNPKAKISRMKSLDVNSQPSFILSLARYSENTGN